MFIQQSFTEIYKDIHTYIYKDKWDMVPNFKDITDLSC